ncbi:hypothetical protein GGI42DRAFT_106617 [Trichoderma sp. SZMC 28013]
MAPHATDESPPEANTNTSAPPNGPEENNPDLSDWEFVPGMSDFEEEAVLRVMIGSRLTRVLVRARAQGISEQSHHESDAMEMAGPSPVEQRVTHEFLWLTQHSRQNGVNGVNGHSDEGVEADQDEHVDEDDRDALDQPVEQLNINGVHEELDENGGHEQRDTGETDHHEHRSGIGALS